MTEEIKACDFYNEKICTLFSKYFGFNVECKNLSLCTVDSDDEKECPIKRLEQEKKNLYEEKNCLHKIIDRLLENAGYAKDIASAEDFEDVYEDMQIKRNELIELEQENKELKNIIKMHDSTKYDYYKLMKENEEWHIKYAGCNTANIAIQEENKQYRSALEEIKQYMNNARKATIEEEMWKEFRKAMNKINEVLQCE